MNELLFDKYKTQIENDTISMVIDDNFIISSLEAFCIKQNIEIKNDDEKYINSILVICQFYRHSFNITRLPNKYGFYMLNIRV